MARKSKKQILINSIRKIINEFGSFTVGEIEADNSPCVNSMGKFVALAEDFDKDDVTVRIYDEDGTEHDEFTMDYEELSVDVLAKIEMFAQDYEADQLRTEKRCSN